MATVFINRRGRGRKTAAVSLQLILLMFFGLILQSCDARLSATRQKLKLHKHLKRMNKPAVKTIKSPDGDFIDCVLMAHQPAFDHPFLKDHKIQTRPNYHPEWLLDENKMSVTRESTPPISQLWHANGKCPAGTIPIRRTKKTDLLRASSAKQYGKKKQRTIPKPISADIGLAENTEHEHAIMYVQGGNYYGAKATINVWEPKIQQPNEFSLSQIWILGGGFNQDLNSIEGGWQVSPDLYGDNNTRLFTYWTSDAYQATGCYNLLCSGFIQVNSDIAMGASISPVSAYRNSQYDISILIWKDPTVGGHWWMQFGDGVLGYWPSLLFSYLTESASMIEWGGEIVNSKTGGQHTSTQMGSGHFPREGFGKASYFRNVLVVNSSNNLVDPQVIAPFKEKPKCYNVKPGYNGDWGHYFYYGGPGKNSDCK